MFCRDSSSTTTRNLATARDPVSSAKFGVELAERLEPSGFQIIQTATDSVDDYRVDINDRISLRFERLQGVAKQIVFGTVLAVDHLLFDKLLDVGRKLVRHKIAPEITIPRRPLSCQTFLSHRWTRIPARRDR